MINCAHPTHFAATLDPGAPWTARIGGIRANAPTMSHAELDAATELDGGDPADLAERYRQLRDRHPHLRVLGGCCGTNHHPHRRHRGGLRDGECGHDADRTADAPRMAWHRLRRGWQRGRPPARPPPRPVGQQHQLGPVIDRTAAGWRSYALDFRGHGRSDRTPGRYRLDDYVDDADRLLRMIGQPAVVVGHRSAPSSPPLAQDRHPLVAAVFLEDPPLYVVDPRVRRPAASGASACCATTSCGCRPNGTGRHVPGPARGVAALRRRPPRRPPPRRRPVVTGRWLARTDLRPSAPCSTGPRSPATTPTGRSTAHGRVGRRRL